MRFYSAGLLVLMCLVSTVTSQAQEPSTEPSTVKIYRVADLVARQTVTTPTNWRSVSSEEWNSEHPQTIESLNNLVTLIETIIPAESGAVAAHAESVSLVVRHTATGHQQIETLLQQLRQKDRPSVELTLIPITGDEAGELIQEIGYQTSYDPETTAKFLRLQELGAEAKSHPGLKPITIKLTNGRKTPCAHLNGHLNVTALATEESDEIRVRIDSNTNIEATPQDRLKILSQSFAVLPGHSILLVGFDLNDDGLDELLLAIPERIEPEQSVTTVSHESAK